MYAQQINGQWTELRGNIVFSPNVYQTAESLSDEQREQFNVYLIVDTQLPTLQPHEKLGDPVYTILGDKVYRSYTTALKTPDEIAAEQRALIESISAQTQERLDAFARTRNYDSILSACTYASSQVPKFAVEGQYCVDVRDSTWASLYNIMAQVEAGTRPIPSGYDDIKADLPVLEWPA